MGDARKDLTGMQFGRLKVIKYHSTKGRNAHWLCKCFCGIEKIVNGVKLRNGHTKSCGCLQKEIVQTLFQKHGDTKNKKPTSEYRCWDGMIQRCYNPKSGSFQYYGARGIKVCQKWKKSFENFLKDMGRKPTRNHSIDRINPDGDYDPDNCRWVTHHDQRINQRRMKVNA
ncbi:MAG: AP2 domain-containing protein [Bacteroidetes bacterium]|nr:AP2 domain-containing protein [Bacteroidota bacterium]